MKALDPPPSPFEIVCAMEVLKQAGVQQTTTAIVIAVEEMRKDKDVGPFTRVPPEQVIRERIKPDGNIRTKA